MSVSPEQFAEWKEQVLGNNMMDVLNAMLSIAEAGDPAAARLLEIAGQNVSGVAKSMRLQMPDGPMTFDEFRTGQIARLLKKPAAPAPTTAEREVDARVERFRAFALTATTTLPSAHIDEAATLVRDLARLRGHRLTSSPEEVYREFKGLTSVRRAEDGDPSGSFGGHFAYSPEHTDDPECRSLLFRVARGRRVELSDDLYDMKRVCNHWIREVRPQQFAFYRLDLLSRFECLPAVGWAVGPV